VEDLIATIKMGENVVHLAVGLDGRGGYTDLRDKYGYVNRGKLTSHMDDDARCEFGRIRIRVLE
jgi:hypothetical protein|tara:strand:- start:391 stop:582 length:192 start_codon:yes stop_codon:yes gene_type:complete